MASIANDKAIIKELMEGSGDIHSLTAYISYPEIPRDTPIKDIKAKYHKYRQAAKGIEFAINYGGSAFTIHKNNNIPIDEAERIYNNYMNGFSGLKRYQEYRRKEVMRLGYILLNPITGHKSFIHNFDYIKNMYNTTLDPNFWNIYKQWKNTNDPKLIEYKQYFKMRADIEKFSINYPIQASGSFCSRLSLVYFFNYLLQNNLLFKVLITILPYDNHLICRIKTV